MSSHENVGSSFENNPISFVISYENKPRYLDVLSVDALLSNKKEILKVIPFFYLCVISYVVLGGGDILSDVKNPGLVLPRVFR